MRERFIQEEDQPYDRVKYRRNLDPKKHLEDYTKKWEREKVPKEISMHLLKHTLGTIPQAWYIQEEICRQTTDWDIMSNQFNSSFSFKDVDRRMIETFYAIKKILFTPRQLWEGFVDEKCLHYVFDAVYP